MKKILSIFLVMLIVSIGFINETSAAARDFDNNAVIRGGAFSKDELLTKINASAELKKIFFAENRGLTEAGLRTAVEGTVTKNRTVIVGGKTVATNAFSSGRSYMPGSTRVGSLWMRPTSVSFRSNSLSAFVVMENGTFKGAVIKSCGNPVQVLVSPFPNVFKRVSNERTGVKETDADTRERAIAAQEGDKLTFVVTVTNRGTGPAQDVQIRDILPVGLNLTDPNRRDASASLGTIEAGSRKNFQIKVTVAAGTAGRCLENAAIMTARGGFRDQDSAWVCVARRVVPPVVPPVPPVPPTPVPPVPPVVPPGQVVPIVEVEAREKGLPAELPQAGPGEVAGSILGLMSVGYAGTNYLRSRKRLRNSLKK